jgi:hypothetical protein
LVVAPGILPVYDVTLERSPLSVYPYTLLLPVVGVEPHATEL